METSNYQSPYFKPLQPVAIQADSDRRSRNQLVGGLPTSTVHELHQWQSGTIPPGRIGYAHTLRRLDLHERANLLMVTNISHLFCCTVDPRPGKIKPICKPALPFGPPLTVFDSLPRGTGWHDRLPMFRDEWKITKTN